MSINYGTSVFVVPGAVADHFLLLASGEQLKVLLYLLRRPEETVTPAQAAAFLHIPAEQAEEAFQFWMQANVLQSNETDVPNPMGNFAVQTVPAENTAPPKTATQPDKSRSQHSSKEFTLTPTEIKHELEHSQDLKSLFDFAEQKLGRMLNHMEQRSLVWMKQGLNLDNIFIGTLLQYCIDMDKYSILYAESIAAAWVENGITTVEQEEKEIQQRKEWHTYTSQIMRTFQMHRNPTTNQRAFIETWKSTGYSMELLKYAYEVTVENIEKLNFKYINEILKNCSEMHITTPEEAKQQRDKIIPRRKNKKKKATAEPPKDLDKYLRLVNQFEENPT